MTRGLRNNNPLNIRKGGDTFQGERIPSRDLSFKEFLSMPAGYRAAFIILSTYLAKGVNTIEKIVSRWAPSHENDTEKYIKFVVKVTKLPKNKILTEASGKDYIKVVAAMSYFENGITDPAAQVNALADVEDGFKLQTRICL